MLKELWRKLSKANLTPRPSKCIFGASTVEFLSHDVGYDWITQNFIHFFAVIAAKLCSKELGPGESF